MTMETRAEGPARVTAGGGHGNAAERAEHGAVAARATSVCEPPSPLKSARNPEKVDASRVLPARNSKERRILDTIVTWVERRYGEEINARIFALELKRNEAGFDPFGFDPDVSRYILAILIFMYRTYFRAEVFGIDHVPAGRALLVGNHSGHLPIDGMIIASALLLDRNPPLLVRSMVEKWAQRLPFVGLLFTRVGQVLGSPDNARRLLEAEQPLLVFPEGVRGLSKPFSQRYQLTEFGPGFMRLAMETGAPVVPLGVVGAEEQYPALVNLKSVAKLFGMPALPIVPQALLGIPLPLPTKYRVYFGEPMYFEGDPDEDDAEVELRVESVRQAIRELLTRGVSERKGIFW